MRQTLAALRKEMKAIDAQLATLTKAHATPALKSVKGLGPVFQTTALALLPELGRLSRQEIAKLVGVAPPGRLHAQAARDLERSAARGTSGRGSGGVRLAGQDSCLVKPRRRRRLE